MLKMLKRLSMLKPILRLEIASRKGEGTRVETDRLERESRVVKDSNRMAIRYTERIDKDKQTHS